MAEMREMRTLTLPNGITYTLVDEQARQALESLDDDIAQAVSEYLAENPIQGGGTVNPGDVDLTGYATQEWVGQNYQPKGEYLTSVPEGYATETFVQNKISEAQLFGGGNGGSVDLSGYATKDDLEDKLDASELPTAINDALTQAKASGEFDGPQGPQGEKGDPGDSAVVIHTTATLSSASWSSSAPYTLTLNVSGILTSDYPHISPVYSDTLDTAKTQKEAWEKVSRAKAAADSIIFYCYEEKPTTDIPIQIEVNR